MSCLSSREIEIFVATNSSNPYNRKQPQGIHDIFTRPMDTGIQGIEPTLLVQDLLFDDGNAIFRVCMKDGA